MGSIGTFGSFNIARLGIFAAQAGLNVTGNNIANVNTVGYTRQSLDQMSLRVGGADRYTASSSSGSGSGVLCTGVSQTRDLYLDIRYRSEAASVGASDTWLAGLNDIAAILDEVGMGDGDGIIEAQFSDFIAALENLSVYTGQEEFETQVRSSAQTLVALFNNYASKLETVEENTLKDFKQDLVTVNELLENIQRLNSSIRKSEIHGDNALELRDERNLLIDQLSEFMDVDVIYDKEIVGIGQEVEKLVIKLGNTNPDTSVHTDETILVDGSYARQFECDWDGGNYDITLTALTGTNGKPQYATTTAPQTQITVDDFTALNKEAGKAYPVTDPDTGVITTTIYNAITETQSVQQKDENGNLLYDADGKPVMADESVITGYTVTTIIQTPDTEVKLDDNDLYGALQAIRELLTESGEFASEDTINKVDENAATKRGIPFYQKALDLLANKFAEVMNGANAVTLENVTLDSYETEIGADGLEHYKIRTGCDLDEIRPAGLTFDLKEAGHGTIKNRDDLIAKGYTTEQADAIIQIQENHFLKNLTSHGYVKENVLFSNRGDNNDPTGITAANISISAKWATGEAGIVNSFTSDGDTANDNILHMITLMDKNHTYNPQNVDANAACDEFFTGSFQEMFSNIGGILGNDMNSTTTMLDTYYSAAVELDASRDNVSSVDLNDEATNLMRYQSSYTAACRLMTTLDEVLNKLINGT